MRNLLAAVLLACALAPAALPQRTLGQQVIFARPLTSVSAPAASAVVTNVGQVLHIFRVEFPAEVATVSPIQVRMEASYDCTLFFPISKDVLEAPLLSGQVAAFAFAYGVFPCLRINNVIATPGGKLMTVRYSGHLIPVLPALSLLADRWAF